MIRVVCTNCGAMYSVASTKIPEQGKEVTCANCHNTWLYKTEEPRVTFEHARVKKGPPGSGTAHKKTRFWKYTIPQIIIMLPLLFLFSSSFQQSVPYKVRRIYRLAEIYDTSHVRLLESDAKVLSIKPDDKMTVSVKWVITNTSEEESFIPGVRFTFYDKHKNSVFSKKIAVDKYGLIRGNSELYFEQVLEDVPITAETVKVRTGNAFEILFY
ncbi:zinc-ribbon domain-containing protein [Candidatus Anaplasma sp. TIGMIC]|nr:zinc-ribbon domain-containing protein [Candidatus Anaplasma sp. TIGMIC]MDB1135280.1 zinc-ribbon domain-containing protein [Candidatus Anaplasma sp. TIGMIC]